MIFFESLRPLILGVLGVAVSAAMAFAAEPHSGDAPPAIQPTLVKLPPPGPQAANGSPTSRPRVRDGTNAVVNFVATNSSVPPKSAAVVAKPVLAGDRFHRANVEEFDKLRAQPDAVVVDVRTPEEFAAGHLPKAGLVDIKSQEFLATLAGLDRSKMYLVNCAAGVRSVRACQSFAALGFTNVVNLDGGFTAWVKSKPDQISMEPAVPLPKSARPNMEKSGTLSTPPPAKSAPTNQHPVFNAPLIIKKSVPNAATK